MHLPDGFLTALLRNCSSSSSFLFCEARFDNNYTNGDMTVHGRIPRGSYSAFRRERTSYGGVGEFSGLRQASGFIFCRSPTLKVDKGDETTQGFQVNNASEKPVATQKSNSEALDEPTTCTFRRVAKDPKA
ncbi:hypothetical protein Mp_2g21780 [Marchantia polymorpha subsp. ruderalis]|uniref:Uncharacterized protein n=1 Tax=Marchantia polymorpha TaxID=3197 RepID=A0A2R6X2M9_MARPO|nr:hypothetical protein MARPO_0040s0037 [Marchantia polymorpha]BBN03225.1 hypothetical protein Mp_2g21780 [Marchantia polymorpha subsp. ruderalis]|eukprot:PTQ40352.1 hypothetical protein MARPO_0040s0037 [Marchantia polymorpha]